jgi:hypothetical protein
MIMHIIYYVWEMEIKDHIQHKLLCMRSAEILKVQQFSIMRRIKYLVQ